MKNQFIATILSFLFMGGMYGQIPSGYYSSAVSSGYNLKTELHNIIKNHTVRTYTELWSYYDDTDLDVDGYIHDMYSENPGGLDSYNYTWSVNQCTGSASFESQCYNREHSFPKSWWGGSIEEVMYSDIHHVIPTDGYVNLERGNLLYGEVSSPTWISQNGSKKGPARSGLGYTGSVFEPIDEYKGDFARIYFYMATRYENVISSWWGGGMLNGTSDQVFQDWAIDMLLEWHANDPVSQKEIDRNNAIYYQVQANRNPFVDHPEFAQRIWGGCAVNPPTNIVDANRCGPGVMSFSPVPGTGGNSIRWYLNNTTTTVFYDKNPASFNFKVSYTLFISSYDTITGCESTRLPVVGTVNEIPTVFFSGLATSYLIVDNAVSLVGSPSGGTFSGNGISGSTFDPSAAGTGTHAITYSYTSAEGCSNSYTLNVNVTSPSGTGDSDLIISAVYDGPLLGNPKGIELYVQKDISDLSIYGIGVANNGAGSDGLEYVFPAVSASAGDYIYCVASGTDFANYMGFNHNFSTGVLAINGDDAIELYKNGSVVDLFGDVALSGVGQAWEYTDGWASRKDCTGPNGGTFNASNWNYSGIDALDGTSTNASAANPIPLKTYTCGPVCSTTYATDTHVTCDSFTWIDGNTYTGSNSSAQHTLVNSLGCDSIVTLDLTINQSSSSIDTQVACGSFTWLNGVTYTTSNQSDTYVLQNAAGCDSIITLNLTINSPTFSTETINTCASSYTWKDGVTYTESNNNATHVLVNSQGCDSVIILNLTIHEVALGTDVINACGSYTWIDGNNYTISNSTASHTIVGGAASGCDSIVTLKLTIFPIKTGTDVINACGSYTWIDGQTYSNSTNTATHTLMSSDGCDSIVTLNLTIRDTLQGTALVSSCSAYTWINGITYTESNTTATHLLKTSAGCDSLVTLNLTIADTLRGTDVIEACESYTWINGQTYTSSLSGIKHYMKTTEGCDSLVTLDLRIKGPLSTVDQIEACESYTWIDGMTYTESNSTATHTLTSSSGCDSIVNLNLTIHKATETADVITTCAPSYTWINGMTYTSANSWASHMLTSSKGCDSLVRLNLTFNSFSKGVDAVLACESYTWIDGVTYTESNNTATYTFAGGSVFGCDSIVRLNLVINQKTSGTDVQTACGSYTWIDGNTYTTSTSTPTFTLTSSQGCDSIVTLNLTILDVLTGTDVQEACGSFTWIDGNTYTASTSTPTFTLTSSQGCDSIVTLNLTMLETSIGTDVQTACESFTWIDGVTYTASTNTPTFTLTGAQGCDSIVTLDLTIEPLDLSVTQNGNELTATQSGASYQWIDCDTQQEVSGATGQSYTPESSGNYAVIITGADCADTSACVAVEISGLDELANTWLNLYPNPTEGILQLDFKQHVEGPVHVYDMYGQLILTEMVSGSEKRLNLPFANGMYLLEFNGTVQRFEIRR